MNQEITLIEKQVTPLAAQVQHLSITSNKEMQGATELLSALNKINDNIVAKREEITKPLNEALRSARAMFKPYETRLEVFIRDVRTKMSQYQTQALKTSQEAEKRISERIGHGRGKLSLETAVTKIENLDRPDQTVRGDLGSIQFITQKQFEIVDFKKVPDLYKLSNDVAIRKAMTTGTEIPGIRYFTVQVPRNTR